MEEWSAGKFNTLALYLSILGDFYQRISHLAGLFARLLWLYRPAIRPFSRREDEQIFYAIRAILFCQSP
jgi:hypothetical protein